MKQMDPNRFKVESIVKMRDEKDVSRMKKGGQRHPKLSRKLMQNGQMTDFG